MVAMGPLPQLYRLLVAGVLVLLGVAGGVWLAGWLTLPLGGVGVGLGAGCLLAFLVTRDHPAARPARAPRRR
jgi:hypothetical protein